MPTDKSHAGTADAISIKSPLPGAVIKVLVTVGDTVSKGDTLIVLEAMKMETEIKSTGSGTVSSIAVAQGDQVTPGQDLIWIN